MLEYSDSYISFQKREENIQNIFSYFIDTFYLFFDTLYILVRTL